MSKKFYITTAIDYVNSSPHIGTAYEKIGADVLARFKRLLGIDTYFVMGCDEHSLNVEKQAKAEGKETQDYCDIMAQKFKFVWEKLNISFDDFIRTTQERHKKSVQTLLEVIHKEGDIYKGKYTGWYCVSCESFLKDDDLVEGNCSVHQKKPDWIEEDNYFFALSKYQEKLLAHIDNNPDFIQPDTRRNEIINMIKGGLEDISISRANSNWGISLPFDKAQVTYVWFDALINYISAVGYGEGHDKFKKCWPCDVHIIGKDITKFHCIIWPAMLMAAGITLPKKVFAHGFVYVSGAKMSKSTGTVIDPLEMADKYGADALRYFLMREIPFDRDGDFSLEKFTNRFNSDLANDLGNLLNRVLNMIKKYNDGNIPQNSTSDEVLQDLSVNIITNYIEAMNNFKFKNALEEIWVFIQRCNRYIEETAPWQLKKTADKADILATVLYDLAESLRIIAILISPFMPDIALKIYEQLNVGKDFSNVLLSDAKSWGKLASGKATGTPLLLFPRIEA